ncbi:NADP-dependent oxidoreductase domain-containing protein [Aspergillus pseudodeflectus]|uniref:NADP-dependent oxidoreductase domain-containing protein n=1 Tax=Aspergillus pseudodeflectus TaxID=176178 RepID=A0ABR4K3M1_9EURO
MTFEPIECQYCRLGNSGPTSQSLYWGCMGLGDPNNLPWLFGEDKSEVLICKALERYLIPRQNVVIMTKCFWGVAEDTSIYAALRRLNTPYKNTSTLHELIQSGKVRYIGVSSMLATQFARLQFRAEKSNWTKSIAMQNQYNLLYREEEREMNAFCNESGVGLIPWAPLCRGHLARAPEEFGPSERSALEKGADSKRMEEAIAAVGKVLSAAEESLEALYWPKAYLIAESL